MPNIYEKLGPGIPVQQRNSLVDVFDLNISSLAAAGSTQAAGATSTADIVVINVATSATADCFRLRDNTVGSGRKKVQYVINRSATQVRVFPPTGGRLNGTLNGSITLTSASHGQFVTIGQSTNDIIKV